jgi:hypothetical protein
MYGGHREHSRWWKIRKDAPILFADRDVPDPRCQSNSRRLEAGDEALCHMDESLFKSVGPQPPNWAAGVMATLAKSHFGAIRDLQDLPKIYGSWNAFLPPTAFHRHPCLSQGRKATGEVARLAKTPDRPVLSLLFPLPKIDLRSVSPQRGAGITQVLPQGTCRPKTAAPISKKFLAFS